MTSVLQIKTAPSVFSHRSYFLSACRKRLVPEFAFFGLRPKMCHKSACLLVRGREVSCLFAPGRFVSGPRSENKNKSWIEFVSSRLSWSSRRCLGSTATFCSPAGIFQTV